MVRSRQRQHVRSSSRPCRPRPRGEVRVRLRGGPAKLYDFRPLFRQDNAALFLVRMLPNGGDPGVGGGGHGKSRLPRWSERIPDGFVVTGLDRAHPDRERLLPRPRPARDRGAGARRVPRTLDGAARRRPQCPDRQPARARVGAPVATIPARRVRRRAARSRCRRSSVAERRPALLRFHHPQRRAPPAAGDARQPRAPALGRAAQGARRARTAQKPGARDDRPHRAHCASRRRSSSLATTAPRLPRSWASAARASTSNFAATGWATSGRIPARPTEPPLPPGSGRRRPGTRGSARNGAGHRSGRAGSASSAAPVPTGWR